ncbi:hypothetical protein HMPREF1548_04735 [Clostridium sp. KLE 1755]|nr:hypothetical protein HMPREF1548_04735 [Clostridium sp. KLE 1755]
MLRDRIRQVDKGVKELADAGSLAPFYICRFFMQGRRRVWR